MKQMSQPKRLVIINRVLAIVAVGLALACGILFSKQEVKNQAKNIPEPEFKKTYPLPAYNGIIVETPDNTPLIKLLKQARYERTINPKSPLNKDELLKLVWAASGQITEWGELTASSYKSKFPLELLVLVRQVDGINPGWYRMDAASQQLAPVTAPKVTPDSFEAPVMLTLTEKAGVDSTNEMKWWEAGEISQNLLLMARELKLTATLTTNSQPGLWLMSVGHAAVENIERNP